MNKKRAKTKRNGIGIYVDQSSVGLSVTVTQLLRLVGADAPSDVRVEAIRAVAAVASRPVTISSNVITTRGR